MHPIWELELFKKLDKFTAECTVCKIRDSVTGELINKPLKLANQSIRALIAHLPKHPEHEELYKHCVSTNAVAVAQSTSSASMDKHVYPMAGLSVLDRKVLHFVAVTSVPFNVINTHVFRVLVSSGQELKDESYYRVTVLPRVYSLVRARVKAALEDCPSLSFTLDVWSGPQASHLSLTSCGITSEWKMVKFVLACREFPGEHNGTAIKSLVEELLGEWSIPVDKCHAFIHDQDKAMLRAFRLSALEDGDCAAHLIHNTVGDILPEIKDAADHTRLTRLTSRCRALVAHFRHSNLAYERLVLLQREHGLDEHRLIQDVRTRWGSTFDMATRLLEQRLALDDYCFQHARNLLLSDQEWTLLGDLRTLLKDFAELQRFICRDVAPISLQVATRKALIDKMNEYNGPLLDERDQLRDSVERRFRDLETYRTHGLALFLDPRFKDTVVDNGNSFRADVRRWIREEMHKARGPELQVLRQVHAPEAKERSYISSLGSKYSKPASSSQPVERRSGVELELTEYMLEECEDWESEPLLWWKVNCKRFPLLAGIAQRYLSAPATSVDSERIFSVAGHVFDSRRSRLAPQKAEQLVFLNRNLPALNYRY